MTAGSANQGATAWQASRHGRGESVSQIPVATPATTRREAERKEKLRHRFIVLTLLAAVIMVDQAAKWWAWRNVTGVNINPGGDFLTGPAVGRWYADPVAGALLDLVGFGVVSIAAAILTRRRQLPAVTVCGSLMVGGWASNLLDRLGMHYWTAPGSIRGAVDFIYVGGHYYNLADFFIIGATPLFLLAAACLARRAAIRPTSAATPAARNWLRVRAPIAALAVAALIMTVALGAAHNGRLIRPAHSGVKCCLPVHPARG
jgi:lipoprotein signal peptidase